MHKVCKFMSIRLLLFSLALVVPVASYARGDGLPDVEEVPLADLSGMVARGDVTAEALTRAYLARIARIDRAGPRLHSIIAVNPGAIAQARTLDRERRRGIVRSALHGIPVLIKDNIETGDPLPTTAGSLALKANITGHDAPVVARLRAAGAVILGKANMSEWANMRSLHAMSGWSAVGGLVKNPYALDRSACGSSSGSAVAVAASLTAASVGTETDGSIVCPAAMNGLVGLKPTVGLVSRTHIVPGSLAQDTAGPMGRSVSDVAILFSAMVGTDRADATTRDADRFRRDFAAGLSTTALAGVRIAVVKPDGMEEGLARQFDEQLAVLRLAGATLIDVMTPSIDDIADAEFTALKGEFARDLNAYLAVLPPSVKTRTLTDLIRFNARHAKREMPFFKQEIFEDAAKAAEDYRQARLRSLAAATKALETILAATRATVIVQPTAGTPWRSDPARGDKPTGPSASTLPAIAGWPHLTVPMGLVDGLPVGISFIARPYSEPALLAAGYAYEQRSKARAKPDYRTYDPATGGEGRR